MKSLYGKETIWWEDYIVKRLYDKETTDYLVKAVHGKVI